MAAIDFPASPTDGQVFNAPNGVTYIYSSAYTAWQVQALSAGFVGDFVATGGGYAQSLSQVVVPFGTVVQGNASGYWNVSTGRYTPSKGRYFFGAVVGTQAPVGGNGTWTLNIRKNGAGIPSIAGSGSGAASFSIPISVGAVIDANGTDYFEIGATQGVAGMNAQGGFVYAFPISPNVAMATAGANAFNVRATATDTISGPNNIPLFRSGPAGPVKDYDPDGVWDLTNARFTAPNAGRYTFKVATYFSVNAAGQCGLVIRHMNASNAIIREYETGHNVDNNAYGAGMHLEAEFQMAAGERVQFIATAAPTVANLLPTAGNIGGVSGGSLTFASGHRIN